MAAWKEFCDDVNKLANKATAKISDAADTASLHIKLSKAKADLSEAYEALGRLVYINDGNIEHIEEMTKEIDELELAVKKIEEILKTKKDK